MEDYQDWTSFLPFFSANSTQALLKRCYRDHHENAEQKSFENCYPFIYYLEHGQVYYQQAEKAPLLIQPILQFYGLVHLIKACLLTVDPNYPETTSVLAHGVSARKKKKQQYSFFEDEVKFQKTGLFPYMATKLFHMKHLEKEKVTMEDLFIQIPELNQLFIQSEGKKTFFAIDEKNKRYTLPTEILDNFHMTSARFFEYWQSKSQIEVSFQECTREFIYFNFNIERNRDWLPIKYHLTEDTLYFPSFKNDLNDFSELLIHYLLLYNLSMIARYETEWWSELIKMMPNRDYPFIQSFLKITEKKGPFLIYQVLQKQLTQ